MISKSFIALLILALTSSVNAAAISPARQFLVLRERTLLTFTNLGFARQDFEAAIATPAVTAIATPPLPPVLERAAAPALVVAINKRRLGRFLILILSLSLALHERLR